MIVCFNKLYFLLKDSGRNEHLRISSFSSLLHEKKVLCSAEKSSVIWAEPHSKSSAEQFDRTERSVYH